MPGIPTEHLADLIQQTNDRLGERIRESNQHLADQIEASNDHLAETNQRLTEAIRDLARKMEEGQKGFTDFKTEVTGTLSSIRNSFRWMAGIAAVLIGVATPVVVNRINSATDRATRTEERLITLLEVLETSGKVQGPVHPVPVPDAAPK